MIQFCLELAGSGWHGLGKASRCCWPELLLELDSLCWTGSGPNFSGVSKFPQTCDWADSGRGDRLGKLHSYHNELVRIQSFNWWPKVSIFHFSRFNVDYSIFCIRCSMQCFRSECGFPIIDLTSLVWYQQSFTTFLIKYWIAFHWLARLTMDHHCQLPLHWFLLAWATMF